IVMGSGASSKFFNYRNSPRSGDELLEAEFTFEYLRTQFDNLRNYRPWVDMVPESQDIERWEILKEDLLNRVIVETTSRNTMEEIRKTAEIFLEYGIERVVFVSSPTHIVRVLRDAVTIFQEDPRLDSMVYNLHAVPCVTCYEGSKPSDVVVIEPPHRPDRHVLPTHRRIQRMLALQKLSTDDLMKLINDFDELLQRYEEMYFNDYLPRPKPIRPAKKCKTSKPILRPSMHEDSLDNPVEDHSQTEA
ncbi:MAG: ElyC/SanA/YdcF family protein, partial [Planctomycetota bacterium]